MNHRILLTGLFAWLLLNQGTAGAKEVYKLQLANSGSTMMLPLPVPVPLDNSRQEWLVITVEGAKARIRHTTSLANFLMFRTWYDHPAVLIRLCPAEGFEQKNCRTFQGDVATLPLGKTIYDFVIDFKYVEGGLTISRSVQIAKDFKPEK